MESVVSSVANFDFFLEHEKKEENWARKFLSTIEDIEISEDHLFHVNWVTVSEIRKPPLAFRARLRTDEGIKEETSFTQRSFIFSEGKFIGEVFQEKSFININFDEDDLPDTHGESIAEALVRFKLSSTVFGAVTVEINPKEVIFLKLYESAPGQIGCPRFPLF